LKRILKTFTFWFVAVSLLGIVLNITGVDDINLFIGFNPLLNIFSSNKSAREDINGVPYLWYILSIATMLIYGMLLDFVKSKIKRAE